MLVQLKTTLDLAFAMKSHSTVLLDFTAIWCGPCRALKPLLESLSERYTQIPFYYIDIDDAEPELIEQFQIQALPTVKIMSQGEAVYTMLGAKPQELTMMLENLTK